MLRQHTIKALIHVDAPTLSRAFLEVYKGMRASGLEFETSDNAWTAGEMIPRPREVNRLACIALDCMEKWTEEPIRTNAELHAIKAQCDAAQASGLTRAGFDPSTNHLALVETQIHAAALYAQARHEVVLLRGWRYEA